MGITVLSLFDGISCGQIALKRAGLKVENYYAAEIDTKAIKVTQSNYPNTVQLGDVAQLQSNCLPRIDLLIGGSPCQGFSFAGKRLNFEDENSKLFFEFVRLLRETNPKYFLLENVKMKKEHQDIITDYLGVEPIMINSNLLSAQNRVRYYWTNIPNVELPVNKGIKLKDITEKGCKGLGLEPMFIPIERHSSKSGLICLGGVVSSTNKLWLSDGKILQRNFRQGSRVYSDEGKSATLNANAGGMGGKTGLYKIDGVIRRLTRLECERLQTVPDGYTRAVSDAQAVKLLGNGWTVDIITHIFKQLQKETTR
jgi:site-specific DNA-cytosine methylase